MKENLQPVYPSKSFSGYNQLQLTCFDCSRETDSGDAFADLNIKGRYYCSRCAGYSLGITEVRNRLYERDEKEFRLLVDQRKTSQ